jgi:hypothetical protein
MEWSKTPCKNKKTTDTRPTKGGLVLLLRKSENKLSWLLWLGIWSAILTSIYSTCIIKKLREIQKAVK